MISSRLVCNCVLSSINNLIVYAVCLKKNVGSRLLMEKNAMNDDELRAMIDHARAHARTQDILGVAMIS